MPEKAETASPLHEKTYFAVRHWKRVFRISRYGLAVIPFIYIYSRVNVDALVHAVARVAWWTIPVTVCIVVCSMFLQGIRWWMLLRMFLPSLPLSTTLSAHFKGVFYSIALPTSAAQDIVRAAILTSAGNYRHVWGSTWVSRLMGLIALGLCSCCGLALLNGTVVPESVWWAIAITFACIVALTLLSFTKSLTRPVRFMASKLVPLKIMHIAEEIREGIYLYREKKSELLPVFLVTIAVQFMVVLSGAVIIKGISGVFYLRECLFFIPIIETAVISIPLTPNGMGFREMLFMLFFRHLGLSSEQLGVFVAISLAIILLRLTGGIPLLWEALSKKNRACTTDERTRNENIAR